MLMPTGFMNDLEQHYSQNEIAERVGANQSTVARWKKTGRIRPRTYKILKDMLEGIVINSESPTVEDLCADLNKRGFIVTLTTKED